ncbi:MAG: histidine--tRNA ligase [Bacteroidota bacterium]
MSANKPSIPKGTRDFSPLEMGRRNYIFDTIKEVFQRYGYLPIETPAMENLDTLTGKYGEDGDKLIFRILNRGDKLKNALLNIMNITKSANISEEGNKTPSISLENLNPNIIPYLVDEALRYDLTVPFARYVVQHQNDITFPFKRYQIQPVWRADRPQKGRYREFYQCDVDVIGSDSLLNEVELIQIIDDVFLNLRLEDFSIKINNRKVLQGIADYCGCSDRLNDITVTIDKFDKIGQHGVKAELVKKGISEEKIQDIFNCIFLEEGDYIYYFDVQEIIDKLGCSLEEAKEEIRIQDSIYKKDYGILNCLYDCFKDNETGNIISKDGLMGIEEVKTIIRYIESLELKKAKLEFEPTLARGLDYYTGTIIEVTAKDSSGSLCGGGRYDDLTGIFGLPGISGTGVSFGADRIYDVLNQRNLFPESAGSITQVMFVNFGKVEEAYCMKLLTKVRKAGINAEIYPSAEKMKKQMSYANARGIPYVVLIGSDEMQSGKLTVKDMESGGQEKMSVGELIGRLK